MSRFRSLWFIRWCGCASLLSGCLFFQASADTSWVGLFGSDWTQGTNWNDGVPGGADAVTIDNYLGQDPVLSGVGVTGNILVGRTVPGAQLTVENGGTLGSATGFIGFSVGAEGELTVEGAGSAWTVKTAYIGGNTTASGGNGTLNILNGGTVEVDTGLTLWTGGVLNVDGGKVRMRDLIDEGGTLSFLDGEIEVVGGLFDHRLGTTFTIDSGVSGKTADWLLDGVTNDPTFGSVTVGRGILDLAGGSIVSTSGTFGAGNGDTTTSDVLVRGAGTALDVGGAMTFSGGKLEANEGATLFADSFSAGDGADIDFVDVNVTLANALEVTSDSIVVIEDSVVNAGSLAFAEGSLSVEGIDTRATLLTTGEQRYGTITDLNEAATVLIFSNADIVSDSAILGDTGNLEAKLTQGASWDAASIIVGNAEEALLEIGKSGEGSGVLEVTGDVSIGNQSDGDGVIMVTGVGSDLTVGGGLLVGNDGDGDFELRSGATTTVGGNLRIGIGEGDFTSSTDTASVFHDSILTVTGDLVVGESGEGAMLASLPGGTGPEVESRSGLLGLGSTGVGLVGINGTNARWSITAGLSVGVQGNGILGVSNGGLLESGNSVIGQDSGASGEITVSGVNSLWLHANLDVGRGGDGVLLVESEGQVSSTNADIAANGGSTGSVTVRDAGSGWTLTGDLYIGGDSGGAGGAGTLQVEGGGLVTADTVTVHPGGLLTGGGGFVEANVINYGDVSPGASPGVLTIDGDFTLMGSGRLRLEVDGPDAGTEYDQLVVTGDLDLSAGLIELDFSGFATPTLGSTYAFFPGQDLSAQPLQVSALGLPPGWSVDTVSFAGSGQLSLIPESRSAVLYVAIGILAFGVWHRRRFAGRKR